jgi:hypothetical protein
MQGSDLHPALLASTVTPSLLPMRSDNIMQLIQLFLGGGGGCRGTHCAASPFQSQHRDAALPRCAVRRQLRPTLCPLFLWARLHVH